MKTLASLLAAGSALLTAFAQAPADRAFPPHTIGNSELRVLPRTAAGRSYQLHIGLPASYQSQPERKYPAVYVTDAYWDFQKLDAIRGCLVYDRVVPEFIIVGLGYAGENLNYGDLRRWELSPVRFGDGGPDASGHAGDFLRTIETEIIPFIEREYRADPRHRILSGASLGGLFTLFSMYSKPELFQAYVAVTPAVVVGNDWLLGYEESAVKSGRIPSGRLFVSGGENESPGFLGGILRYNERVVSRRHPDLAYQFRVIEGERHAGMQLESYVRGLRFVFAPQAPETGPARFP
ncbi:MAG TPA: alpha/beta hydrolase-fold protein [Opitutaceae bacterium]|nr:alpha/beta hydrolase-fold protein [Opitutaceae bacterium]